MGRNYLAVPYEFSRDTAMLNDEEVGRLIRALLRFSETGEDTDLTGNERFLFPMLKNQELRFKQNYEEISAKRSEARKKRIDNKQDQVSTNDNKSEQTVSNGRYKTKRNNTIQDNTISSIDDSDTDDDSGLLDELKNTYGIAIAPPLVKGSIPTESMIELYCKSNSYRNVDAGAFYAYYEKRRWQMNGGQIERWWTVVDAWEKNPHNNIPQLSDQQEHSFNLDEFVELAMKRRIGD